MEAQVQKRKRPRRRKPTKRRKRKIVLKRAKARPKASAEGQESKKHSVVAMVEFTNRHDNSSTIYVCTSPQAALHKAILVIVHEYSLRSLHPEEADSFLQRVGEENYGAALEIWNTAQERSTIWTTVEIWSAHIHDEEPGKEIYHQTEKAWRHRIGTQPGATA